MSIRTVLTCRGTGPRSGAASALAGLLVAGVILGAGSGAAVAASAGSAPTRASEGEFPDPAPASRVEAAALLSDGTDTQPGRHLRCLTPALEIANHHRSSTPPGIRRSVELLERSVPFASERVVHTDHGTPVRFTTEARSFDRVALLGEDPGEATVRVPALVRESIDGLRRARDLMGHLGLGAPRPFEVLFVELGEDVDGYVVRGDRDGRDSMVLDATPRDGLDGARRAAIHQLVHLAVAGAGPGLEPAWAEALAVWANLALEGTPDEATLGHLARRVDSLHRGLLEPSLEAGAGNALWFSFLQHSYGVAAIRSTIAELAGGTPVALALEAGVRSSGSDDLAAAMRDFQLWCVLVGDRSTGSHFPYAERLTPRFASSASGLPALSVQADPPVAPLGAAAVRLRPELGARGGLQLQFEGGFAATWQADLLLIDDRGGLRRLPLALSADGDGEIAVPLENLREVLLLVRNLGKDSATDGERYTYTAHQLPDFPFRLTRLDAGTADASMRGSFVQWETTSEQSMIGFNLLRQRADGGGVVTVNPVWIPAMGELDTPTLYGYFDPGAQPGVAYQYRVQGVTVEGLTSVSDAVSVTLPYPPR